MKYMCMIFDNEKNWVDASPEEQQAIFGAHMSFTEEAKAAGVLVGGEALQPSPTASVVTARDTGVVTTDGPFLESKEQLGGYYIVECASAEEAAKWAAKIPEAKTGHVEVRAIMSFD